MTMVKKTEDRRCNFSDNNGHGDDDGNGNGNGDDDGNDNDNGNGKQKLLPPCCSQQQKLQAQQVSRNEDLNLFSCRGKTCF